MLVNFYSIYDVKANIYSIPFVAVNEKVAKRTVQGAMLDTNSILRLHPSDYRLFCVGQFDDESALVFRKDTPQFVCELLELFPESTEA